MQCHSLTFNMRSNLTGRQLSFPRRKLTEKNIKTHSQKVFQNIMAIYENHPQNIRRLRLKGFVIEVRFKAGIMS